MRCWGLILEMCQMEMAVLVVEAKRAESGEAGLNEIDRRHLRRAAFAAADCDLLRHMDWHPTRTRWRKAPTSMR